jgi:hypothetical protein
MITREQLLEECEKDAAPKNRCSRCGGTGMISIGGGCMGYDDEVCPKCHGDPNCLSLKEVLEGARNDVHKFNSTVMRKEYFEDDGHGESGCHGISPPLMCNRCGASLCTEEWHDCDREYEWQRAHG